MLKIGIRSDTESVIYQNPFKILNLSKIFFVEGSSKYGVRKGSLFNKVPTLREAAPSGQGQRI